MNRSLKLVTASFVAALCAACLLFGGTSAARVQEGAAAAGGSPRGLTPQERRGKGLYLRGESPSGREIIASVGELEVPGSTVTCAGCHGLKGEGKTEGGITAGNLTWSHLLKPGGHTHPSGRRHGPFDEAAFVRAVTKGVDSSGNELLVAMPRYRMSAEDLADLVAYLKRIETDTDPGITDDKLTVGTVLPQAGALAEMGGAMRDVLAAYFEDVNARGGLYNRKIELRVTATGEDAASTAASVRRFAEREQVFALVGGMSAGADSELAALAAEQELPFIGPSTLTPQTSTPINRQVFYLLPGVAEQSRALVNFAAARQGAKNSSLFVAYPQGELAMSAASAVEDQAKKAGWSAASIIRLPYARADFDAARLVQRLKQERAETVFFLGSGGEDAALIKEAGAAGWTPSLFMLGIFTSRDLTGAVTPAFKDRIFLSFPTIPSDVNQEGVMELRALQEKYKFRTRHTAAQLSALAAAKVFVEALKRAGRDLSREKLVASLESLYEFETGLTPRLTFGPNRRVGAAGANIVTVNPDTKEFTLAGGWVKAY